MAASCVQSKPRSLPLTDVTPFCHPCGSNDSLEIPSSRLLRMRRHSTCLIFPAQSGAKPRLHLLQNLIFMIVKGHEKINEW